MRVAAALLVLLLSTAAHAGDDLARLVEELGGADAAKRTEALNALRQARDPRVLALLEKALPGFGDTGRYYAVLLLDGYFPKDTQPVYRRLLGSEDPWLALAAATALHRMGERNMIEPLVRALHRPGVPDEVRVRMLYRLTSIWDPEVWAAIRRFVLPGAREQVLGAALSVLATLNDRSALPLVKALDADDRPGVRAMAAAWRFRFGEAEGAAILAEVLAGGRVPAAEFSRLYGLLLSAPPLPEPVLAALSGLLETPGQDTTVLLDSIRLLSRAGYRKAVGAIRGLLSHSASAVARAAFDALLELDGGLDRETLRPLLDSKDPDRRLLGADALRRMNDHSGLAAVIGILATGEPDHRSEAARVLGGFRVAAAVEPLLAALSDGNSVVRMRAQHSLSAVLTSLFPYRRVDLASTGYSHAATPEANREAIAAIRAFWEQHRGEDW